MAKYDISIPDYIESLCIEQLENAIKLAKKRLKTLKGDKKYCVFSAHASDLDKETVYFLADGNGLRRAREQIAKWVNNDVISPPQRNHANYGIDSFYCYEHELNDFGLSPSEVHHELS